MLLLTVPSGNKSLWARWQVCWITPSVTSGIPLRMLLTVNKVWGELRCCCQGSRKSNVRLGIWRWISNPVCVSGWSSVVIQVSTVQRFVLWPERPEQDCGHDDNVPRRGFWRDGEWLICSCKNNRVTKKSCAAKPLCCFVLLQKKWVVLNIWTRVDQEKALITHCLTHQNKIEIRA